MAEFDSWCADVVSDGYVQVIINGAVFFEQRGDVVLTSVLHDDEPPCEMKISVKYGRRVADGIQT